jgi:outer membrane protein
MLRLVMLGVFLVASSPVVSFAEDVKLGYVDLQRALNETEDGRKAKANLKKVFDQKQKELNEQQDDLKKAVEDLDKKRTLMPPDKVREKEAELNERMQKVQQTYLRHQQDLQAKQDQVMGKIVERMNRILIKIALTENFTMIFDKTPGGLVFAKPELDVTNELIRRYNSGEGAEGGPAGKAPAAAAPGPAKKK